MTLRKTLRTIFLASCTISFLSMVGCLFLMGHTEFMLAPTEKTFTGTTLALMATSAFFAVVAGVLQWVGLPAEGPPPENPRRKR